MKGNTLKILMTLSLLLPASVALAQRPLTEAEQLEIARRFETAVNKRDLAAITQAFDVDAMLERATRGYDSSEPFVRNFRAGAKSAFKFAAELVRIMGQPGAHCRLLRVRQSGTEARAVFRFIIPPGLNYHEYIISAKDGRLVDAYVYLSGELLSETIRRPFLTLAAQVKGGVKGAEKEFLDNASAIPTMAAMLKEQKFQQVMDMYRKLPTSVQKDKLFMLLRLQAAMQLDEKEYARAIADYESLFPTDPALNLISLDGLLLKKKYDACIQMIDRLDRGVGGDPYLKILRAGVYFESNRQEQAAELVRKAFEEEPGLKDIVR